VTGQIHPIVEIERPVMSDVDAIKIFRERTDVAPNVKQKILSDNARALYGLN